MVMAHFDKERIERSFELKLDVRSPRTVTCDSERSTAGLNNTLEVSRLYRWRDGFNIPALVD